MTNQPSTHSRKSLKWMRNEKKNYDEENKFATFFSILIRFFFSSLKRCSKAISQILNFELKYFVFFSHIHITLFGRADFSLFFKWRICCFFFFQRLFHCIVLFISSSVDVCFELGLLMCLCMRVSRLNDLNYRNEDKANDFNTQTCHLMCSYVLHLCASLWFSISDIFQFINVTGTIGVILGVGCSLDSFLVCRIEILSIFLWIYSIF